MLISDGPTYRIESREQAHTKVPGRAAGASRTNVRNRG